MSITKRTLSFAAGLALLGAAACNNDTITEANKNPNAPEDAPAGPVFTNAAVTAGRLWGTLDFRFSPVAVERVSVDLGALELSCERDAAPGATTLVPCYGDLVAAVRGRSAEFHGALTAAFAQLLSDIFVGRLTATGIAANLDIRSAAPSVASTADNATLHLELDAAVAPAR